ncbi:tellurite resistance/C4-dicarboxylate transporter family protein [Halalkalicoccus salilacus]|uniref:tellurite resistance/C4-dicarboxylate transporter family protein n=1 Tax=Halalkalicoccus salilacus TaxID=3117459 RepID=UPI00300F1BD0
MTPPDDGAEERPRSARSVDDERRVRGFLERWDPIYFAFVMATGIVAIASRLLAFHRIAWGLFGLNVVAYLVVGGLTLAKIGRSPAATLEDLAEYDRGVGSFTAIAGTCVLGSQFVAFEVSTAIATGLLVVGGVLWFVLIYAVFAALTIRDTDEPIDRGIDGTWFLAVVATQSVATLTGLLAPVHSSIQEPLLLAALGLYSIGGTFYLLLITLVFYRLTLFPFDPREASPPYWINTGAVAITTLAGAILLENADGWSFLTDVWGFLAGFTFFFWAAGTWWIPLLVVLGVWRHTIGEMALPHTVAGYDPRYWGMVFPLGMYTASTFRFATATDIGVLDPVPELFIHVALLAWVVVGIGLVRRAFVWASRFAR